MLSVYSLACGDDGSDPSEHDHGPGEHDHSAGGAGRGGASGTGPGGRAGGGAGASGGRAGSGGAGSAGGDSALNGSPITIQFHAKVGDAKLDCASEYAGQGATKVRVHVQDFRMFVQQVALITADGREVPVQLDERAPFQTRDVALLDFTDRKGACLTGGGTINATITGTVPDGDYTGIAFVNGVPESLNHANITLQKPPLQDPTIFWGWQSGYRFIVAEIAPSSGSEEDAGTSEVAGATFVHIGSVGCTGNNAQGFTCTRPNRNRVVLRGFDPKQSSIVVDFANVFKMLDLTKAVECHGPNPECTSMYAALGVDLETGDALDSQSVFKLE